MEVVHLGWLGLFLLLLLRRLGLCHADRELHRGVGASFAPRVGADPHLPSWWKYRVAASRLLRPAANRLAAKVAPFEEPHVAFSREAGDG